jgi:hypothetical protein
MFFAPRVLPSLLRAAHCGGGSPLQGVQLIIMAGVVDISQLDDDELFEHLEQLICHGGRSTLKKVSKTVKQEPCPKVKSGKGKAKADDDDVNEESDDKVLSADDDLVGDELDASGDITQAEKISSKSRSSSTSSQALISFGPVSKSDAVAAKAIINPVVDSKSKAGSPSKVGKSPLKHNESNGIGGSNASIDAVLARGTRKGATKRKIQPKIATSDEANEEVLVTGDEGGSVEATEQDSGNIVTKGGKAKKKQK